MGWLIVCGYFVCLVCLCDCCVVVCMYVCVCDECDEGEVVLEVEVFFEVGCSDEGALGVWEDAGAAGGGGLDVVGFPEKMTEAGGVAVGFARLCTGSECD